MKVESSQHNTHNTMHIHSKLITFWSHWPQR